MSVLHRAKGDKILQLGARVFGITDGMRETRIEDTIEAVRAFFRSLGLSTYLHEENIGEEEIREVERRFNERGVRYGEDGVVNGQIAREILMKAL